MSKNLRAFGVCPAREEWHTGVDGISSEAASCAFSVSLHIGTGFIGELAAVPWFFNSWGGRLPRTISFESKWLILAIGGVAGGGGTDDSLKAAAAFAVDSSFLWACRSCSLRTALNGGCCNLLPVAERGGRGDASVLLLARASKSIPKFVVFLVSVSVEGRGTLL